MRDATPSLQGCTVRMAAMRATRAGGLRASRRGRWPVRAHPSAGRAPPTRLGDRPAGRAGGRPFPSRVWKRAVCRAGALTAGQKVERFEAVARRGAPAGAVPGRPRGSPRSRTVPRQPICRVETGIW